MKTLNSLDYQNKVNLNNRINVRFPRYRTWENVAIHTRLLIIKARVMMSLSMHEHAKEDGLTWPTALTEARKKLKDPLYIMKW